VKRLIEFPLEDGGTILVEVDEPVSEGGLERVARPDEIITKANQTFEAALDRIKPVAGVIITKLRALSDPPDEMTVEFGFNMSAQAGAVVAAVGVEANYKVTLKWQQEQTKGGTAT
jgi:hypothetical protein